MSTPNTLTNLLPDLYEALDIVSRELVGFIPAVNRDSSMERAALNQNIRSFYTNAATTADITPGLYAPDDGNQTVNNIAVTISKSKYSPIRWNGEEQKGVNSGPGYMNIRRDQIVQSMRALCNLVEADLAALFNGASRAEGTAGTTPFGSNLSDIANVRKILADNGAPMSDLQMVIDTVAGAKMRSLTQLTNVNQAADMDMLRQGTLQNIMGFNIRESAQVKQAVTVGTGSSYVVNAVSGLAVGTTTIPADVGTGTILAGDIITIAGDSNQYVVATALSAGSFTINAPGLKQAHADEDAITVVAAATRNMAFDRNAIVLVTRAPLIPVEGDNASDAVMIQDPRSGLAFDVRMYKQYRQVKYELGLAWGSAVIKPAHLALMLG